MIIMLITPCYSLCFLARIISYLPEYQGPSAMLGSDSLLLRWRFDNVEIQYALPLLRGDRFFSIYAPAGSFKDVELAPSHLMRSIAPTGSNFT